MLLRKLIEEGLIKGNLKKVAEGTCLFVAGGTCKEIYYLVTGIARLTSACGMEQLVFPGALLGLPDLMHETHSQTLIASENLEVLCIAKEDLQQALQANASLRFYLIQELSKQARLTSTAYE